MKITKKICQHSWTIGFSTQSIDEVLNGKPLEIIWVENKFHDRWFADPFILDVDDNYIYVLVEEFYDPIERGRLAELKIERKSYNIVSSTPILELDTHLSFPAIIRKGSNIFIAPENYESGKFTEYIYNIKEKKCIFNKILVERPLMDAIITNIFGEEILFSTCYPDHKTLEVYKSSNGSFAKTSQCVFNDKFARNAGDWFEYKGHYYRPSQDCSQSYGRAIVLQEVIVKDDSFQFINKRRIESDNKKYNLGCHTFNTYKGYIVFDAKAYRYPVLHRLYSLLKKMIRF